MNVGTWVLYDRKGLKEKSFLFMGNDSSFNVSR